MINIISIHEYAALQIVIIIIIIIITQIFEQKKRKSLPVLLFF